MERHSVVEAYVVAVGLSVSGHGTGVVAPGIVGDASSLGRRGRAVISRGCSGRYALRLSKWEGGTALRPRSAL